jgi:hypothetical protein
VMIALVLAAALAGPAAPTPLEYYSKALATMQGVAEPAYMSFQTNVIGHGWGIAEPCDKGKVEWSFGWGRLMHHMLAWHTLYASANNTETIRTDRHDTCSGPAETFDRPTWRDAYAWVRYGFSQPSATATAQTPQQTVTGTLKTIANVSVIAPGAYRVFDGGAQSCPSGLPRHELHFTPRFDPVNHLLRDVVIETSSMRICMIRLDLDSYQAAGTGYRGDLRLDFSNVAGNWVITRGHAVLAARMAGISLKTASLDFWFTDMTFPSTEAGGSARSVNGT